MNRPKILRAPKLEARKPKTKPSRSWLKKLKSRQRDPHTPVEAILDKATGKRYVRLKNGEIRCAWISKHGENLLMPVDEWSYNGVLVPLRVRRTITDGQG